MKKILFVVACVGLVLAFALASRTYRQGESEAAETRAEENSSGLVRSHSPTLGSAEAEVVLVEFLDPACETCAAFSPFVKQLMAAHPGKIRLVIRYAPFHPGADQVVAILEASRKQDRYWETLDVLFGSQGYWASHHQPNPENVWPLLSMAGLDVERLREDSRDPAIAELIRQDLADAEALGVQKTPGFFVNGRPLAVFGYQPLKELVESEVRARYPE